MGIPACVTNTQSVMSGMFQLVCITYLDLENGIWNLNSSYKHKPNASQFHNLLKYIKDYSTVILNLQIQQLMPFLRIQTHYPHRRRFIFGYQQTVEDFELYSFLCRFTHIFPTIAHHMQLLKTCHNVLRFVTV